MRESTPEERARAGGWIEGFKVGRSEMAWWVREGVPKDTEHAYWAGFNAGLAVPKETK